jgi:hypothetical protein
MARAAAAAVILNLEIVTVELRSDRMICSGIQRRQRPVGFGWPIK